MECKWDASKKKAVVPKMAEANKTRFFGNLSANQPNTSDKGTPRKRRKLKIAAPVCASTPERARGGPIYRIEGQACEKPPDFGAVRHLARGR